MDHNHFLDRAPGHSPLLDEQLRAGLRGDFAKGMAIAERLERETPDCNRAAFNRAWYEMMKGNLSAGLSLLDRGRWENVFGSPPLRTDRPIWRDENLEGMHLLLRSEGGLGDEIINVRFAADFARKGARVSVSCHPSLCSVFARVEGVSSVVRSGAAAEMFHHYWVPAMSAARLLGYEYSDLKGAPYLSVDVDQVLKWRRLLMEKYGDCPRIGLRFYGNPQFEHEQHRRFPSEELKKCIGDRNWVNLQIEESDLPIRGWEDTLGILANLDLVITSCTSVAHASAALGIPTWIILPILPYYLWAKPGSTSPWYNSVRLFRQQRYGDWSSVFEEIRAALAAEDVSK